MRRKRRGTCGGAGGGTRVPQVVEVVEEAAEVEAEEGHLRVHPRQGLHFPVGPPLLDRFGANAGLRLVVLRDARDGDGCLYGDRVGAFYVRVRS